jgi:phosphate transport system protein
MPRESFQEELDALRENVLYMGELVADRLRRGLDALETKDTDLAEEVIEADAEINELYLQLEGDCIDLFVLQQPVASDLRFVASTFKILTDLERIGDLATNLGEYTLAADHDVVPEVDVQAIGDVALAMLDDAMTAYADEDVDACYDIAERDDELDALCETASSTIARDLIESELGSGAAEDDVEQLIQSARRLLLTVRDLERVGDHAVNIAARTLYAVEGSDELI